MNTQCFLSPFKNIYWNLALEEYLYKNGNFLAKSLALLWTNEPCVVIGRHQNPFLEANIPILTALDYKLARRNSGGGTVVHDNGNLNLTFFTSREKYNRRSNLMLVQKLLEENFSFEKNSLKINENDDLTYKQLKFSGSAAKLSRTNAYHHFTLLISSDLQKIQSILHRTNYQNTIRTKATQSKKSKIINLHEIDRKITIENILNIFNPLPLEPSYLDMRHVADQLGDIHAMFSSWEWIFGRTPPFQIQFANHSSDFDVDVENGYIRKITFNRKNGIEIQEDLKMRKFDEHLANFILF